MKRILLGVMVSAASMAPRAFAQCPDGSPPPCAGSRTATPPATNVRARRFLVLPFRNVTRKAEQEWLVTGAPLMLSQSLGQFKDVDVIPEERLAAARRRIGLAGDATPDATQLRKLADETGGWTVVSGNVFATGNQLRITAQTLDAVTQRVLARAEVETSADGDPRDAFDRLTLRILAPLGVPEVATTLVAMTTSSIDAYRSYVSGVQLYERSRFREALADFSQAVRLDSTFALAWMGVGAAVVSTNGIQELLNANGTAYRATEHANRLSDRLNPRQALFVRAMRSVTRAEIRRGRAQLDSLLRDDPNDLNAAYWLANAQYILIPIDTTVRPWRLDTDLNRAIRLSRFIIDRDSRRGSAYQVPLLIYGLASGLWWGDVFGFAREFSSLAASMLFPPDLRAVPVVSGDTLVLMPRSTFDSLDAATQAAHRRRSAEVAWQWAERALLAGADDAESHMWASRIADVRGDYERAWREMSIADSLGVQSGVENVAGRRLSALLLSGRRTRAAALADSMLGAGTLTSAPFLRTFDRRRPYGAAAFLVEKQWDRAARMAELMGKPRGEGDACVSLAFELGVYDEAVVPPELKRAIMDTVAAHAPELQSNPVLAPCVRMLSTRLLTPRAKPD